MSNNACRTSLSALYLYTYEPGRGRGPCLVEAGNARDTPAHLRGCLPPYRLETLQPSAVLRRLHAAGWNVDSDAYGQKIAVLGNQRLRLCAGAATPFGALEASDCRYLDALLAARAGQERA